MVLRGLDPRNHKKLRVTPDDDLEFRKASLLQWLEPALAAAPVFCAAPMSAKDARCDS